MEFGMETYTMESAPHSWKENHGIEREDPEPATGDESHVVLHMGGDAVFLGPTWVIDLVFVKFGGAGHGVLNPAEEGMVLGLELELELGLDLELELGLGGCLRITP